MITYLLTISKYFIKVNVMIIYSVKKVIYKLLKILSLPFKYIFKFIRKIFNKPFMSFVVNVRKLTKNIKIKKKNKKVALEEKEL